MIHKLAVINYDREGAGWKLICRSLKFFGGLKLSVNNLLGSQTHTPPQGVFYNICVWCCYLFFMFSFSCCNVVISQFSTDFLLKDRANASFWFKLMINEDNFHSILSNMSLPWFLIKNKLTLLLSPRWYKGNATHRFWEGSYQWRANRMIGVLN